MMQHAMDTHVDDMYDAIGIGQNVTIHTAPAREVNNENNNIVHETDKMYRTVVTNAKNKCELSFTT